MQLMEMKAAKEMGDEADPDRCVSDLEFAAATFAAKMSETQRELESLWLQWDTALDARRPLPPRSAAKDAMVTLLNKRSYLRNLVRDVTAALET